MMMQKQASRYSDWLLLIGSALGITLLLLMQGMTTYTYDDYYYSVFLGDGFVGFLEKNAEHYLLRNGRVLVHVAAELLIGCGRWVYSFGNTVIFLACGKLGLVCLDTVSRTDRPLALGCTMTVALLGGMRVLRSWFLCPADSCNYMLPMLIMAGMLLAVDRSKPVWAVVLSLLCGATTELYAAMGFGAAVLLLLLERWKDGRWNRLRLICLGLHLLGLATILLSPATRNRVSSELSLEGIGFSFLRYANSIAAPGTSLLLLTGMSVLLNAVLPGKQSWIGWTVVVLLGSSWFLPRSTVLTAAVFGVFCAYVLLCAVVMLLQGKRTGGVLLLAGLGSVAVMTLSNSGSVRVTIPFVLCLMPVGIHLLIGLAQNRAWIRKGIAAMLCMVILAQLPAMAGIAGNWRVMQRNEQALREGSSSYTDYDPRYATQQLFLSQDYQRVYLQYLGLTGLEIRYNHTPAPDVELNGKCYPAVRYAERVYLPLRAVVEESGGTVKLISDSFLEIHLGDVCWLYQAPRLYGPDGSEDVNWDFLPLENSFYASTNVLSRMLGITITEVSDGL